MGTYVLTSMPISKDYTSSTLEACILDTTAATIAASYGSPLLLSDSGEAMSLTCSNCGSTSTFASKLYDDQRWGRKLQYHKCLHCLAEFHTALPDTLQWYTSGEYHRGARISKAHEQRVTSHRCHLQVKWMDEHDPEWRSSVQTIWDIGAYRGVGVAELRSQGFEAMGYEPNRLEADKSEFVTSEVSDVGNVDMLWFSHVLEHTSTIDILRKFRGFASKAFIEVPPGDYQLPHVLVFQMDAMLRTIELANMHATKIDSGIRAILEW